MGRTHYEVLGVDVTVSAADLATAHRRAVRGLHPDAHPEWSPEERRTAETWLAEVNDAWSVLRDPVRRAVYDSTLGVRARRAAPASASPPGQGQRARGEDDRPARKPYVSPWAEPKAIPLPARFTFDAFVPREHSASLRAHSGDLSSLSGLAPDDADAVVRLRCSGQPVTDEQLVHVARLRRVRVVDLADTLVGDDGMEHLTGLGELAELDLWATKVGDRGVDVLSHLPELRHLNLGHTRVTDEGLGALERIPFLHTLDLRGTRVRGPGLAVLHGIEGLALLHLPRRVDRASRAALVAARPHTIVLP